MKLPSREPGDATAFDGSVKEQVYKALKADVLGGTFDMGERLNESQLTARYGVSRAPLREALTMLQRDGLIEVVPRVGYVTSRITPRDVMDIFELRILIEGETARKAASRITDAALDRLGQLCSEYQPGDRRSYRRHLGDNLEFHRIIAEAADNRRMVGVLTQLMEHMLRLLILRLDRSTGDDVVREHIEMVAALRQHDPVLAHDLMVRHLTVARQATIEAIMKLMANWQL